MCKVYRGADCPTCGYTVHLCHWQNVELKQDKEVIGFCDMCETYLNFEVEEGKIVAKIDKNSSGHTA